ncbi:hypothetical protein ACWGI9_42925 [Streptomyces sp. NPDC054833]
MVGVQDLPAGIAAGIGGLPHALVTDRCDVPLRHFDESALEVSGLRVYRRAMRRGSDSLHAAFDRVVRTAEVIVTDRACVPEPDGEISIARAQSGNRAVLTGPIVPDLPEREAGTALRARLGLGTRPPRRLDRVRRGRVRGERPTARRVLRPRPPAPAPAVPRTSGSSC